MVWVHTFNTLRTKLSIDVTLNTERISHWLFGCSATTLQCYIMPVHRANGLIVKISNVQSTHLKITGTTWKKILCCRCAFGWILVSVFRSMKSVRTTLYLCKTHCCCLDELVARFGGGWFVDWLGCLNWMDVVVVVVLVVDVVVVAVPRLTHWHFTWMRIAFFIYAFADGCSCLNVELKQALHSHNPSKFSFNSLVFSTGDKGAARQTVSQTRCSGDSIEWLTTLRCCRLVVVVTVTVCFLFVFFSFLFFFGFGRVCRLRRQQSLYNK